MDWPFYGPVCIYFIEFTVEDNISFVMFFDVKNDFVVSLNVELFCFSWIVVSILV